MAEMAPTYCPKCGAEKEWRCTEDPSHNKPAAREIIVQACFGLLGRSIYRSMKKVKYHCDKCGFEASYKQDG